MPNRVLLLLPVPDRRLAGLTAAAVVAALHLSLFHLLGAPWTVPSLSVCEPDQATHPALPLPDQALKLMQCYLKPDLA